MLYELWWITHLSNADEKKYIFPHHKSVRTLRRCCVLCLSTWNRYTCFFPVTRPRVYVRFPSSFAASKLYPHGALGEASTMMPPDAWHATESRSPCAKHHRVAVCQAGNWARPGIVSQSCVAEPTSTHLYISHQSLHTSGCTAGTAVPVMPWNMMLSGD